LRPLSPPNDTPMPTPSVKECSVMTKISSSTLRESRPVGNVGRGGGQRDMRVDTRGLTHTWGSYTNT
jgi:hypothetical protein